MRITTLVAVLALIVGVAHAQQEPRPFELDDAEENLAIGQTYLFSAIPSYRLTNNETDLQDLTDGLLTSRADDKIWFDAGACAWHGDAHVNIRLDLGEVQPIAEIGIRLLGGAEQGGLKFPAEVVVMVSDDGQSWGQVGRFVKPVAGKEADDQFGMPPEEGVAYTYPLRFVDLNTAGRYVAFMIGGDAAFIASDEMWVLKGEYDLAGADRGTPYGGDFVVHNFQAGGVTAFFPKARIYACDNVQSYQTLQGFDNRPEPKSQPAELIVDLPDGVTLRRWKLNQRFGGTLVDAFETEQIADGDRTFTRYIVPTRGIYIKNWGTLFFQTEWEDGRSGPMRLGCRWEGGEQEPEDYTIEAVHIYPVTPPKRLHMSIAWMTQMFWQDWPDFIETYRSCGFNAVPLVPRYAPKPDTDGFQKYLDDVAACREAGLQMVNNSSPIHAIVGQKKDHPEVMCQLADGPGPMPCPSYRGELWNAEVEVVAQRYAWTKAEWMLYDCEAYSGYGYRAEMAKGCTRCQAAFAERGGVWEKFIADQAAEFYRAVHERIQELAPGVQFQAGAYGVKPGEVYHGVWDWDILYPDLHQFSMPSMYGFRPGSIGDSVRKLRELMTANDIIPWLQPGDLGEMPAEYIRAMLLEALFNGGRGVAYYTSKGFDGADLRAVSEAVAIAQPIEDMIMDGQLLDVDEFRCEREGVRLGGIRAGDQVALLVSEYDSPTGVECTVQLPEGVTGEVHELTPDGKQPAQVAGGTLDVVLDSTHARVFLMTLQ